MKVTLLLIFLFVFGGCTSSTGPDYPADADEILDFGIIYARYGNEWWSVKDGEKWNQVYGFRDSRIYPNKGKQVVIEDFGSYASIIESVVFNPYSDEPNWGVIFYRYSWVTDEAILGAYTRAWNTDKYKKIVLSCAMGCMSVL